MVRECPNPPYAATGAHGTGWKSKMQITGFPLEYEEIMLTVSISLIEGPLTVDMGALLVVEYSPFYSP